jgi:hypothetical protein
MPAPHLPIPGILSTSLCTSGASVPPAVYVCTYIPCHHEHGRLGSTRESTSGLPWWHGTYGTVSNLFPRSWDLDGSIPCHVCTYLPTYGSTFL